MHWISGRWPDLSYKSRNFTNKYINLVSSTMDDNEFPQLMRTLDARFLADLFPNINMVDENTLQMSDEATNKNEKRNQNKNYAVKKRPPLKPVEGDNVIFVTKKTNFKAQLDKCVDLLTKGEKEIILHGLGAAIQRCCNLAIQTQLAFPGTHEIEVNTGTIDLVDDLIPMVEDLEFSNQYRYQSSVHIRIFRKAMIGSNQ